MEQTVNSKIMLIILAAGVFGILNTEMGFIGILPYIAEHYHVSIVQAGWLISLFALGVAAAGPAMPLFMSRFNRRNVLVYSPSAVPQQFSRINSTYCWCFVYCLPSSTPYTAQWPLP